MTHQNLCLTCKELGKFDLVVVGGGCTGVFAAVRAARKGLKVAIVEKSGCFGGVATNGLINIWHSLYDIYFKEQIIFGLTDEVEKTLLKGGYGRLQDKNESAGMIFDPNALKWILDRLVSESGVKIFFHTFYSSLILEDGGIKSVVVSNKDGLGIISGEFFIDATGDGDLCRDAGLEARVSDAIQPPSPACFMSRRIKGDLARLIGDHGAEFGLDDDWGWSCAVPGLEDTDLRVDFHIFGSNCANADRLSAAEVEGRRKMYAFLELLKKYDDPRHGIAAVCSQIGIRETNHYVTNFRATETDLLLGREYGDTVMKGTYRVDVHHSDGNGISFKYLSGRTETFWGKGNKAVTGNWRREMNLTGDPAPYYSVPFGILVQNRVKNLIPVGRMINADPGAFGALRVMVNLNQLGEAAGVGAYLAVKEQKPVWDVCGKAVQKELQ
ncbi:MAG: FAD-dependent oxidoreductase [Clostridia bacterium]|nr:FAD-dependent oxidoreductase [Clostridia bacterium]